MRFGKKRPEEEIIEEPIIETQPVEEKPAFTPAKVTVIAKGVTMVGDFITADPIELKGEIRGNIVSETSMHISKSGNLNGDARVSELKIDGNVNGSIIVEGLSSISSSGVMKGSLQTSKFSSEPGSVFDGTFSMASSARKKLQEEE